MIFKVAFVIIMSLSHMGFAFNNNSDSSAKRFLNLLPESDRSDFLIFSLRKGYTSLNTNILERSVNDLLLKNFDIQPDLIQRFETLEVPENFETNLYSFTKDTFQLSQRNMDSLIRSRKICFNRKKCINIDDIGNMCCPF